VRGEVFGPECLAEVLGPEGGATPRAVPSPPPDLPVGFVGLAFLGAVAASVMPWTRFGVSSGWFGGWGFWPLRWPAVATAAAIAGLGVWALFRGSTLLGGSFGPALLLALAAATFVGALMHMLNPPPFTHPWLGPWVAAASAAVAASMCAWILVRGRLTGSGP